MAEYGTPIGQTKGTAKRNVPGEADAATRKKKLAEALRPGPPVKKQNAASLADTSPSVFEGVAQLARRGQSVDAAVDDTSEYRRRQNQIATLRRKTP